MDIVRHEKARFEKNALIISDTITLPEWKDLGQALRQVEGCVQFWIGDWARYGDKRGFTGKYTDPKVYDELESITGLKRKTIQQYKWVAEQTSSNRLEDMSFTHHIEVAKLPPEKQEQYLKKASEQKLSVRDLREQIREDSVTFTENIEIPNDKYDLVYADPPWQYGNSMPNYYTEQANYYPLMSIDQICQMPIKEIINKDAVLFLWVTSPMLQDAFKVIEAWGFKYKTSFVWDKIKHNMGHYSSVRHEFLLLAIRGSYPLHNLKLYDSVYSEERTEHSKKPQFYYQMIEDIYCNAKKIELFSREKREGWYSYGNQL